jgi:hypothetical protein
MAELLGISLDKLHELLGLEPPAELQGGMGGHRVPRWLSLYESLVQEAGQLWQVEKAQVPALLQTRAYAATIERYGPLPLTDEQLRQRVEARLARQAVLRRDPQPLQLVVLMAESALHEMVGGHGVMVEQYNHLVEQTEQRSNIELRIIPPNGRGAVALGNYQLIVKPDEADPFVVCTFDVSGPHYDDDEVRVGRFVSYYDYLISVSLPPSESTRHIANVRETMRS